LICLLMTGVENKKSVYEVNGHEITIRRHFSSKIWMVEGKACKHQSNVY
jgi:hypothetical protein